MDSGPGRYLPITLMGPLAFNYHSLPFVFVFGLSVLLMMAMQSPSLHLCKSCHLGFQLRQSQSQNAFFSLPIAPNFLKPEISNKNFVIRSQNKPNNGHHKASSKGKVKLKGKKENVWSIDNEIAEKEKERERAKQRRRKGRRVDREKRSRDGKVLVSGAMLMEVETLLQTQVLSSWFYFEFFWGCACYCY